MPTFSPALLNCERVRCRFKKEQAAVAAPVSFSALGKYEAGMQAGSGIGMPVVQDRGLDLLDRLHQGALAPRQAVIPIARGRIGARESRYGGLIRWRPGSRRPVLAPGRCSRVRWPDREGPLRW